MNTRNRPRIGRKMAITSFAMRQQTRKSSSLVSATQDQNIISFQKIEIKAIQGE